MKRRDGMKGGREKESKGKRRIGKEKKIKG